SNNANDSSAITSICSPRYGPLTKIFLMVFLLTQNPPHPPVAQGPCYQKQAARDQFQPSKRKKGPIAKLPGRDLCWTLSDRFWQISRSGTGRCSCRSTPALDRRHVPRSSAGHPRQSPAGRFLRSTDDQYPAAAHHHRSAQCPARQCQTPTPAETAPAHFLPPEQS